MNTQTMIPVDEAGMPVLLTEADLLDTEAVEFGDIIYGDSLLNEFIAEQAREEQYAREAEQMNYAHWVADRGVS